ncbi:MAG TPA: hypothetical protein VME17_03835 [Bryobacteraceae bacterium]|nr:hypothetical protein [Bryobacteraceae bacterium]
MTYSLLTVLMVAWAAVTVIFLSLVAYRSLIGMKEEDTLILSAAESKIEEEQKQLQIRLHHIEPYLRAFGWASAALLVTAGAIWLYRGIQSFFT